MLTTQESRGYPDEDPMVKRRKTNNGDSSKIIEQTNQTIHNSNGMMPPTRPRLTVRRLEGDRLSKPRNPNGNIIQHGDTVNNVIRDANNAYFAPGYSIPDPRFVFGDRDVQNVWPERMPVQNEPFQYEYRPSSIARPYPVRMQPVYSYPGQFSQPEWIQNRVTGAFTPVWNNVVDSTYTNKPLMTVQNLNGDRLSEPELQTFIVTTQSVIIPHPSSIQSLRNMLHSVATTVASSPQMLSANGCLPPVGITYSKSSRPRTYKPAAQPNATIPLYPVHAQESNFQPSHIPGFMASHPSLQAANQTFHSVTATSVTIEQPFNTPRIISTGPSTFQTSIVPSQPVITPSSIESLNSMVGSFPASTTPHLAEDLSMSRVISYGSSRVQDVNPVAQPIPAISSSYVQPESSHIPDQTVLCSPHYSLQAENHRFCSANTNTTTTVTTSSAPKHSVNRNSTTRVYSAKTSKSRASKRAAQPNTPAPQSTFQPMESSQFKIPHIPVQTIMPSPSYPRRAATRTATVTTLSATENSHNSAFSTSRIMSTGSSTTQAFMNEHSSSIQSPRSMVRSAATSTTVLPPEDLSFNSALTHKNQITSQYENFKIATQSIPTAPPVQPPISSNSQNSNLTTRLLFLSPPATRQSSEPLTSQISNATIQPSNVAPSSSLQSSVSTTTQPSQLTHLLLLSTTKAPTTQTFTPTRPVTAASSSSEPITSQPSPIATHLLLLSPPATRQPSEPSQIQNSSLAKLLLLSPPANQIVCTATTTTTTTTSPIVASSSLGDENLSEDPFDGEETIIQSVLGEIKINIPRTIKSSRSNSGEGAYNGRGTVYHTVENADESIRRRKEIEIAEKDALLQRMYSVPAFGGKVVKSYKAYEKMLTKSKLCHLFKCMASLCTFTCNQKTLFDQHIAKHQALQKKDGKRVQRALIRRNSPHESKDIYDWQQCAYCCESTPYTSSHLSDHVIAEHGYCEYQCAYCFYRALFQNYVDIHQSLAHREILNNKPRFIYRCKTYIERPSIGDALNRTGIKLCVRPYHCDQCGSQFLITEEFLAHLLKKHHSVTNFTCHICKSICFKPDRLLTHYKLHAFSTYQCAYCLHGTENERKMIFHLCTFHFAQPACLYVRAWQKGKPVLKKTKNQKRKRLSITHELEYLKMISYDIEAPKGDTFLEEASDDEDSGDDRLVIDESHELNDIIAELGIATDPEFNEVSPRMPEYTIIGNSKLRDLPVSALLPNARFSLECDDEDDTYLISCGSSSAFK